MKFKSTGTIFLDLKLKNYAIQNNVQIVDNDFPIPSDGIIGMDFVKQYNCILGLQLNIPKPLDISIVNSNNLILPFLKKFVARNGL